HIGPAAVGLGAVVMATHRREVAAAGQAAVVAVGVVVDAVVDAVVVVAGAGLAGAPGEDTGDVAEVGLVLQPLRCLVGVDVEVLGQVQDRLHGDVGVGLGAPAADLGGG